MTLVLQLVSIGLDRGVSNQLFEYSAKEVFYTLVTFFTLLNFKFDIKVKVEIIFYIKNTIDLVPKRQTDRLDIRIGKYLKVPIPVPTIEIDKERVHSQLRRSDKPKDQDLHTNPFIFLYTGKSNVLQNISNILKHPVLHSTPLSPNQRKETGESSAFLFLLLFYFIVFCKVYEQHRTSKTTQSSHTSTPFNKTRYAFRSPLSCWFCIIAINFLGKKWFGKYLRMNINGREKIIKFYQAVLLSL